MRFLCCWFLLLLLTACNQSSSEQSSPIRVAVAANFAETLRDLAALYETLTGQAITISVGSTGALTSQIRQGAPFDLF